MTKNCQPFIKGMSAARQPVLRAWCVVAGLGLSSLMVAEAAGDEVSFNRDVLPILAEHCYACHGPDKAGRKGGLQINVREEAVARRKSGEHVILPGKSAESLLVARVVTEDADEIMPPPESGGKLTERQVEILRKWIDAGAKYEPHWAFIPPQRVAPPAVADAAHPVDRFIRERLQQEGIEPAPEADLSTLIRRVSLDLTGLPPSREEVEAFIHDSRPDAYGHLVDRLLTSVHYGEKWARWWLDLAHYGDSDGIRLDSLRPHAWRYRQWVVDSLNRDLSFDQFTIQQLAGDQMANATESQRMGTGFLRNTISDRQTGNADPALGRVRMIVNRTSTVGAVWMGLTVECAECHDHKFDPISQKEFFELYAFFNSAEEANINAPLPGELEAHLPAKRKYDLERTALLAPLKDPLDTLQAEWEEKMRFTELNPGLEPAWMRAYELFVTGWGRGRGEGQFEGMMIAKTPPAERTAEQQQRLQDYFIKSGAVVAPEVFKELKLADLSKQLELMARKVPPLTRAQAMTDMPQKRDTWIHVRGDFRRPGASVSPGTPGVLPAMKKTGGEPTRLDLAQWLVSPENPLTSRVTVNRLWQEVFGAGLVATSDNVGMRGERPTHPELLDWLAAEFPANGWSVKQMLRLMVTSEAYRQSSDARPDLAERDPENKLLARQVKLRLSAEGVRDTALATGGLLDRKVGGPSVRPVQPESVIKENSRNKWKVEEGSGRYRRGLYTFIQRLTPFAQFTNFDLPGTATACARRGRSNTPLQALNLLNDPTFVEAAGGLANRVWQEVKGDDADRLEHAFLLALARRPTNDESTRLISLLKQQTALYERDAQAASELAPVVFPGTTAAESAAWVTVASVLLNLHEFFHRE
jgi:hypothetical protein